MITTCECDRCGQERPGPMMQLELVCDDCAKTEADQSRSSWMKYLVERYIQLVKLHREVQRLKPPVRTQRG